MYLEKYIDEDLRREIKTQYRKDLNPPTYESIFAETNDCLSLDLKNSTIIQILFDVFKEASQDDVRKELDDIKKGIEIS